MVVANRNRSCYIATMVDALTRYEALEKVVKVLGSQAELARICGVSHAAVWKWLQTSKQLPAEYVLRAEAATGVSRHLLRPDIYPVDLPPAGRFFGVDQGLDHVAFQTRTVSKRSAAA